MQITAADTAVRSTVWNDDGTVTVTRQSGLSRQWHTVTMRFTERAYQNWHDNGMLIQQAMPGLTNDEREFLMTGITPAEWDAEFGDDE